MIKISTLALFLILLYHKVYPQHTIGFRLKHSSTYNNSYYLFQNSDNTGNGIYTTLKMNFGSMIYFNEMCLSSSKKDMLRGSGKKIGNFYGYSNQGYILFNKKQDKLHHQIIIGRAYIKHGFGKSGQLLISNWSRPFDQIGWELAYKGIKGRLYGIQLDYFENSNRYLSLHIVDFVINKNITISFGESLVYAGEDRGIELQYFNPTLFWVPIRENQEGVNQANSFLYTGLLYKSNNLSFWAEFLLDDYQIDREIKEPMTYGFISGLEIRNLGSYLPKFWVEYVRIANQTYQTNSIIKDEDYIHRSYPIGHYLGNDFDNLAILINFSKLNFNKYSLIPQLVLSVIRDGANGLDTPWEAPWLIDGKVQDPSYEQRFPTRPIKSIFEFEVSSKLIINQRSDINLGLMYTSILNEDQTDKISGVIRYNIFFGKDFNY